MARIACVVLVVLLLLSACQQKAELEANVAVVEFGDRRAELEVTTCGLDEAEGVLVLAASSADLFLQVLLVVEGEGDDRRIDRATSGVTLEVAREGLLGAGDADLLQVPDASPGEIVDAGIRGDRVDVAAAATALPSDAGDAVGDADLDVVARCSDLEEEIALGV